MLQEFKPVLKNKNFLCIWISQIFSQLTINIMNFVFLIRLFEVTGSAISTSLLWVSYALPAILIGPFASGAVDLVDRRKMLIVTNLFAISDNISLCNCFKIQYIFALRSGLYLLTHKSILCSGGSCNATFSSS